MGTGRGNRNTASMETILTFDNRDNQSDWSVEWSTEYVPGMDNAARSRPKRRAAGRRRLRMCALAVGCALVTHARVPAAALTGGLVVFYITLVGAVALLANPLRHFEVYLGQWSISGPGRAFRMVPMLDGIGIAICINCIVRAIGCCYIAAITTLYVVHSASDEKLPFTHCRDWDIKPYEPTILNATSIRIRKIFFGICTIWQLQQEIEDNHGRPGRLCMEKLEKKCGEVPKSLKCSQLIWRADLTIIDSWSTARDRGDQLRYTNIKVKTCKEKYEGEYPSIYSAPAYNFFYVEMTRFRLPASYSFDKINLPLLICNICIWVLLWLIMVFEHICHGRLIWNNIYPWFVSVPWIWTLCLAGTSAFQVRAPKKLLLREVFKVSGSEILAGVTDAFEIALYIHSASTGTEIIHGKGLNHYASGHIDPDLNSDNVWHSGLLLLLVALHCGSAAVCALADIIQPGEGGARDHNMRESTLWIIPMYSRCTASSLHNYTHAISSIIFAGLSFSYVIAAYTFLKTALHTIFEYRVKLVFVEQLVVAGLMICCMALSLPFFTTGGLPLLESVEAVMSGVTMPIVCLLELAALLWVYRSSDFMSDINIATEENECSTRISSQWQIIPLITLVLVVSKIIFEMYSEMPTQQVLASLAPLVATVLAVPLRGVHNAIVFMKPAPRRGT